MAEGFEQCQVPHRKDKLRVNSNPPFCLYNNSNAAALLPLYYDPSLLSSDLINQSFNPGELHPISPSSSSHMYLNPQLNPNYNNVQEIPNSQTLCLSLSSYPLEFNLQRHACVLKGSRFLKPAQALLEEFCDFIKGFCFEKDDVDISMMESYSSLKNFNLNGNYGKSRLISMLDEVYKGYKQYHQQIQTVITSFESISGLSSAAPLASMVLKALSKRFGHLKKAISDQLQFSIKSKEETAYNRPVWRPQRGLPERAVTVLRAWLFEHFLHPYPTDTDKLMLAKQTGLSRNQVSNWFINARVRLWKPMVEEIHMLETQHDQKDDQQNREDMTETPLPYDNFSQNPNSGAGSSNASDVSLSLGLHQNEVGLSESYTINAARCFGLETEQSGQFGRDIVGGQLPRDFVW